MPELEHFLLALTAAGALAGSLGIFWARSGRTNPIVFWGRVLFVTAELFLAGGAWFAALVRADGLVPLGLAAGFPYHRHALGTAAAIPLGVPM